MGLSTVVDGWGFGVHGGIKVYRGSAIAAHSYVGADRSRVDDYYLAEGTGVSTRYVASPSRVHVAGAMDGPTYERWADPRERGLSRRAEHR